MNTTTMTAEPGEIAEQGLGRGLVLGVIVGIPLLFAVVAVVALLAGAGLTAALQIAGWPAIVAGPYAGGFIVLTWVATHQGTAADVHFLPTRGAAGRDRRAAA